MADLIDRQAAIDVLERKKDKKAKGDMGGFYNKIIQNDIDALMQLPSAERKKRGKWIQNDNEKRLGKICCSACNRSIYLSEYYRFCPNCGADMRGEGND